VAIRHVDMRRKDGIIFSRLHLTADITKPVAERQGWGAALDTDGWDSMKLVGELRLAGIHMEVSGLNQSLDIKADEARDFMVVRPRARNTVAVGASGRAGRDTQSYPWKRSRAWQRDHGNGQTDENETTHVELRFVVVTTDHPSLIYEYWNAVGDGDHKAALVVALQDETQPELPGLGQQVEKLDGTNGPQKAFFCADCENDVPLDDEDPSVHVIGSPSGRRQYRPCQHPHAKAGPSLASKQEVERTEAGL